MLVKLLKLYWRESCSYRTFAFLVIMILITMIAFTGVNQPTEQKLTVFKPVRISVVDEDQSLVSLAIINQCEVLPNIETVYTESLPEAKIRLQQNEIMLILVIPQGFYSEIVNRSAPARLTVQLNERMPDESTYFIRLLDNSAASISNVQAALAVFQREAKPLFTDERTYIQYSEAAAIGMALRLMDRASMIRIQPGSRLNTIWFVIAALCCLFAVLPALLVLLMAQRERAIGQLERLILANVSWFHLHLAKILIGLMWLTASLLPMLVILKRMLAQIDLAAVFLAIIFLYTIAALLCLALAYRSRNTEALMLTAWLGLMALLMLGGCIYPWQLLPVPIQRIGTASPAFWAFSLIYQAIGGSPVQTMPLIVLTLELLLSLGLSRWSLRAVR
jgi:hypothetical protein